MWRTEKWVQITCWGTTWTELWIFLLCIVKVNDINFLKVLRLHWNNMAVVVWWQNFHRDLFTFWTWTFLPMTPRGIQWAKTMEGYTFSPKTPKGRQYGWFCWLICCPLLQCDVWILKCKWNDEMFVCSHSEI